MSSEFDHRKKSYNTRPRKARFIWVSLSHVAVFLSGKTSILGILTDEKYKGGVKVLLLQLRMLSFSGFAVSKGLIIINNCLFQSFCQLPVDVKRFAINPSILSESRTDLEEFLNQSQL